MGVFHLHKVWKCLRRLLFHNSFLVLNLLPGLASTKLKGLPQGLQLTAWVLCLYAGLALSS